MSNAVYPVLAGLAWPVKRTPEWNTRVQKTASGRELRAQFYSYPRYTYELQYEFLRGDQKNAEFQALMGFFNARGGQFDTFLFDDQCDDTVPASAPQQFGIGDGSSTTFQLARAVGGYVEPVLAINGTPTILISGAATSAFTVQANGMIQFASPPPAGAPLTWSGQFYWVVRFAQDTVDFEEFAYNFWRLNKVQLITVKP
ncbi:DUF2460 domain-containing protein [Paludibacterium purpuratum]|uniref:Uncharacterized protein (TIGR02217 family) n=1 Tax=Paludibacterium purpuratum TaxID=1144873 RepID=A0A4R7BBF3_9NEIS|nr:DUF2460 domain-containing protein [Paludibacterium purpuratum]TDR82211.1 uncharacterized protein (TIGR02217 family) [Paludibacterium purpuratum]